MKAADQKILEATYQLARAHPYDKITYADIANMAGVHRSTVQRFFGSKEKMRDMIRSHLMEQAHALSDTKTKILDAAEKIFAKYGFQGATLDTVAKDAGLTKGAVYWHFSSKNDLYLALCERSLRRLLQGLPEQVQAVFSSSDVEEALQDFFASQFAACELQGGERTMLFFEFILNSRDDSVKEKLSQAFSVLFEETSKMLRDLQDQGLIRKEIDSRDLSIALHSFVNGVVLMWLIAPNQVPLRSLAKTMATMLLNGIR